MSVRLFAMLLSNSSGPLSRDAGLEVGRSSPSEPSPYAVACNPATIENCCSSNLVGSCGFTPAGATGVCATATCDTVTFDLLGLYDGVDGKMKL
jgi:hypothetical protein